MNEKNITLTDEQKQILDTKENLVIEAMAGSGKTTTLIQYSLKYKKDKKLYFAFNRAIADEAKVKFADWGVKNISVSTAHSLAYRQVIIIEKYILGYNPSVYDLSKKLVVSKPDYKLLDFAIKKFEIFCNSNLDDINQLDMINYLESEKAKYLYLGNKSKIDAYAKKIWNKMLKKEISVSHSFYLKKYQLSKPKLNYDIIMIDELQDANPVILDIFTNQTHAIKIGVGDSNQAIYGWRGAVDAIGQLSYKRLTLTESFRFHQDIANVGLDILSYKEGLKDNYDFSKVRLIGRGNDNGEISSTAYLSRSNMGILIKLIGSGKKTYLKPYIEGGLDGILKFASGYHILDLYFLYKKRFNEITNYAIKSFSSLAELIDYYEDIDDGTYSILPDFFKNYENNFEQEIQDLKNRCVSNIKDCDFIFSTIHKSKGKEYDQVTILNTNTPEGFPSSIPVSKVVSEENNKFKVVVLDEEEISKIKNYWNEELNIYYVAVTRAKYKLDHNLNWLNFSENDEENFEKSEKKSLLAIGI